MANILRTNCSSSEMKTTLLWTNSSPSSSFTEQSLTLSKGVSNFDYILIVSKRSTESSYYCRTLIAVSDLTTDDYASAIGGSWESYVNAVYARGFFRKSSYADTMVRIGNSVTNGGTDNSRIIPVYIYGVKGTIKLS